MPLVKISSGEAEDGKMQSGAFFFFFAPLVKNVLFLVTDEEKLYATFGHKKSMPQIGCASECKLRTI